MPLVVLQPCSNLCSSQPLSLQKALALQLGSARAMAVTSLVLRGFTAQLRHLDIRVRELLLALLTLEKVEKRNKKSCTGGLGGNTGNKD